MNYIAAGAQREASMKTPEEIAQLKTEIVWHLETAKTLADELSHAAVKALIETAINTIRTTMWPADS